jgi:hypothetical protein
MVDATVSALPTPNSGSTAAPKTTVDLNIDLDVPIGAGSDRASIMFCAPAGTTVKTPPVTAAAVTSFFFRDPGSGRFRCLAAIGASSTPADEPSP